MVDESPIQLRADYAQSFISSGVFLRAHWRDKKQERRKQFPHGKIEQRFCGLSMGFPNEEFEGEVRR